MAAKDDWGDVALVRRRVAEGLADPRQPGPYLAVTEVVGPFLDGKRLPLASVQSLAEAIDKSGQAWMPFQRVGRDQLFGDRLLDRLTEEFLVIVGPPAPHATEIIAELDSALLLSALEPIERRRLLDERHQLSDRLREEIRSQLADLAKARAEEDRRTQSEMAFYSAMSAHKNDGEGS